MSLNQSLTNRTGGAGRWLAIALSGLLYVASLARVRGENRLDYRYDYYAEDAGRVTVATHGLYFDTELKASLSLQGNFIIDSISGATPDGSPPLSGETSVATSQMSDKRYAGYLQPTFKLGNHTLSPQLAYSEESDYGSGDRPRHGRGVVGGDPGRPGHV